ncbi:IQ and AAA domain-containing protein 1-like isoform X2 [Coccinella septempunctata]|nr:IQ and AAA domain-containing protein 1-like isoform X2 [Coccinella septempunctata]
MYERIKNGERIYTKPSTPPPELEEEPAPEANVEEATVPVEEPQDAKKEKKKKRPPVQTPIAVEKKAELSPEEKERQKKEAEITAAVEIIQRHERARQARLYHREIWAVFLMHKDDGSPKKGEQRREYTPEDKEKAARTLQRVYRGHYWRNYLKKKENERRLLIGMTETSFRSRKEYEIEEQAIEERRKLRELRIKQYIDANLAEKDRILRVVGPGLMEDIGDEIREWFYQWYLRAKNFDKYPPEDKGGTILVVRGETMTPEEWIDDVERKRREKVKAGGSKEEKEKKKAEKAKQKAAEKAAKKVKMAALKKAIKDKKKRRNDVVNYQMEFDEPEGSYLFAEGQAEHVKIWNERDEMLNPEETHYMDLITDQRCYEVQLEMRQKVDEMMRLELELLNDALARDKNKKPKKPKKPKAKRKKGKKPPKDITAHRTTEEIFQELVDNGIIRLYPKTRLDEFIGDFSYNNMELRQNEFLDPPPCLGDVKQAIVVDLILPLGLSVCKQRVRSAILCGPPQSGKKILANAIFTATRCVLFDLSPEVLAGKYPGKPGLNMLLHLVMKMSKLLQPSILFFNAAEKPFYKKVPAEEKDLDPKRLGKVLLKKVVKVIKPEDRVMLLGLCNQPWAAAKKMNKLYEKAILIPRSDYGSVFIYWREQLMPYHSVDRGMDLSSLSKLTVKYPLGVIKEVTKKIMTPSRIVKLYYQPLQQIELFEPFTKIEPITDKVWKKYEKWYNGTPVGKLGKKYAKYQLTLREEMLKRKEAEEKQNEKKGKKK